MLSSFAQLTKKDIFPQKQLNYYTRDGERNKQTRKVLRQPRVSNQVLGEEPRSETLVHKQFASSLHSFFSVRKHQEPKYQDFFVLKHDKNQQKTCTTTKKEGEKE